MFIVVVVVGKCIVGLVQDVCVGGIRGPDNLLSVLFTSLLFFLLALILLLDHGSFLDFNLRLSLKLLNLKLT